MARKRWAGALLAAGLFGAIAGGSLAGPGDGATGLSGASGGDYELQASVSGVDAAAGRLDAWRLGTLMGPAGALGAGPVGHVMHWESAWGRAGGVTLPGPALQSAVQEAWYCLVSSTGSYPPGAELTLEAIDYAGNPVRSLSATPVDLGSAPVGAWSSLPLAADASVGPGEALAFRVAPAGGPEGDLAVDAAFEVQTGVRRIAGVPWAFLPNVLRGY